MSLQRVAPLHCLFAGLALSGCAVDAFGVPDEDDWHNGEPELDDYEIAVEGLSLSSLGRGCSTAGTERISEQLLEEMLCMSNGAFVEVSHPNIRTSSNRVHLYLSPEGASGLMRAASQRSITINSAFRTLAEQYVLKQGCNVAANPGSSRHETGRAIDVADPGSLQGLLESVGFDYPDLSGDPWHFDAPGRDLRSLSVKAFQVLWNANNPGDEISESGSMNSETSSRLRNAPAEGFRVARVCGGSTEPPSTDPPSTPPPVTGGLCRHSSGGSYGDRACSAGYQCCGGTWRTRAAGCGTCACVETTGRSGCSAGTPPPPPAPPPPPSNPPPSPPPPSAGPTCSHSFGGVYANRACSQSYQCCDGSWRSRTAGCGTCACVDATGQTGCGTGSEPPSPPPPSPPPPSPPPPSPPPSTGGIELPPVNAQFDYQIGGPYTPPSGTRIVSRDHAVNPAPGLYNICYVNAFQTQPGARGEWPSGTTLGITDPGWPGEYMVDTSTDAKRRTIAAFVGRWIDECADRGYDAVEIDNLDSYTRAQGRLTEDNNVALMQMLSAHAHRRGMAIGQKNSSEIRHRRAEMGTDFAIVEECNEFSECQDYIAAYGRNVIIIEYQRWAFDRGCAGFSQVSITYRDRDVTAPGSGTYVYDEC